MTGIERVRQSLEQMSDLPAPEYIHEHGREWEPDFDRITVTEGGRCEVFVDESAEWFTREIVRQFAIDRTPAIGQCYSNALKFAAETGAEYVEGYALLGGSDIAQSHAWNVLDDSVIDTTAQFRAGIGCVIPEEDVEKAVELGRDRGWWGIVFNEMYPELP